LTRASLYDFERFKSMKNKSKKTRRRKSNLLQKNKKRRWGNRFQKNEMR